MVNVNNIEESNEPKLCHKCDGVGSIWIYNKEEVCGHCNGKGLEPLKSNIASKECLSSSKS